MTVTDIVIIIVLVVIVGGAITYIVRSKKNGAKCIGCPYSKACAEKNKKNYNCRNK